MLSSRVFLPAVGLCTVIIGVAACSSSSPRGGFDGDDASPAPSSTTPAPTSTFGDDGGAETAAPEVNEVYGHSADTLFKLDPKTNVVTTVGTFSDNDGAIVDIALDAKSTLYAVSYTTLYTVDKNTGKCSSVASGTYPNSLSFVPAGTLDPGAEALVGYVDSDYVRIDTTTGVTTKIGSIGGGLKSSGDIVSVKGGATYLTVKASSGKTCVSKDCLVEVDPKTGAMVKNWGDVEHHNVFGLSFWGGKVYGFDDTGELFAVTFGSNSITTTAIEMPSAPSGLKFYGAGSSTSAPLTPR